MGILKYHAITKYHWIPSVAKVCFSFENTFSVSYNALILLILIYFLRKITFYGFFFVPMLSEKVLRLRIRSGITGRKVVHR